MLLTVSPGYWFYPESITGFESEWLGLLQESTLSVELLTSGSRTLDSGVILYDYEYEIESTRGRKRILNSVTIAKSKLYIFNAQVKCGKESCSGQDLDLVSELRRIALTFYVA